jgi:hypothetical protein
MMATPSGSSWHGLGRRQSLVGRPPVISIFTSAGALLSDGRGTFYGGQIGRQCGRLLSKIYF